MFEEFECVDTYEVQIWESSKEVPDQKVQEFIEDRKKRGWDYADQSYSKNGIRTKFTKSY